MRLLHSNHCSKKGDMRKRTSNRAWTRDLYSFAELHHNPQPNLVLVQAAIGCCILLLLVLKMVLPLCNLCWWWCLFCHQLAQRSHLQLQWASLATCTGDVFLAPTSTFTNAHTWLAMLPPPTATCTGSVFPLPTRHLIMCTQAFALRGGGKCMIIHTRAECSF